MEEWEHINPDTNELIFTGSYLSKEALEALLLDQKELQLEWKEKSVSERLEVLAPLKALITSRIDEWAVMATQTMGKPIIQAKAEVQKCIALLDYYQSVSETALEKQSTDVPGAEISMEPLGLVLGVMPWNFPYWQVFRYAIPALISGNTVLLKHAPNTFMCGALIEEVFNLLKVKGLLRHLTISHEQCEVLLKGGEIAALSFTGSTRAGKYLGAIAGGQLLPTVMELGGNNTFYVDEDADLDAVISEALLARLQNNGQSCIAAKRFMIHEKVMEDFEKRLLKALSGISCSNPMEEQCQLGPMARLDLAEQLEEQYLKAVAEGAEVLKAWERDDAKVEVSVLKLPHGNNIAFKEELFGPVFVLCQVASWEEMIDLNNQSKFGLGAMLYTQKTESEIQKYIGQLKEGAVFVNHFTKSHPALPFGGIKESGYGRELGIEGLYSFLNKKLIWKKA